MWSQVEHSLGNIVCLTFEDVYNSYLLSIKQHQDDSCFAQHYIARKEYLPADMNFEVYLKMATIQDVITRSAISGCMLAGEHIEKLVNTVVQPEAYPLFLEYIEASQHFTRSDTSFGMQH